MRRILLFKLIKGSFIVGSDACHLLYWESIQGSESI